MLLLDSGDLDVGQTVLERARRPRDFSSTVAVGYECRLTFSLVHHDKALCLVGVHDGKGGRYDTLFSTSHTIRRYPPLQTPAASRYHPLALVVYVPMLPRLSGKPDLASFSSSIIMVSQSKHTVHLATVNTPARS